MSKQEYLENKVEDKPEGVMDVLRTPLKRAFSEGMKDLDYRELIPGGKFKKAFIQDLTTLVSFGIQSIPHELIHAGTNVLTGGTNEKIVINRFYGGDLLHRVYSGIDAELLIPLIGGYVKPSGYGSTAGHLAMTLAPYIITPIGLYLLNEGKKRKSLSLAIAGGGAVALHLGGVIGDFFHFGRTVVGEAANFITHSLSVNDFKLEDSFWTRLLIMAAGFYVGNRVMSLTYRLSKAAVNNLSTALKKK